jgi:DmsE family decaheme c-type cytochrome
VRNGIPRLIVFTGIVALSFLAASAASDDYAGAETCAVCHEDEAAFFSKTAHAVAPGWDAEKGCESCHGPGMAHAEGGEIDAIIRPRLLSPHEASATCLTCHDRQERQFRSKHSMHALSDVGCVDCHTVHSRAENEIEGPVLELCAGCHQTIAAQFDMPRAHPLPQGGKACSNCHDPHGSRSLRTDTTLYRETCVRCHFDKAGPFLYDHDVALLDGCVSCHDVHGSPNRHLLKQGSQVNLCYQCHTASATPECHDASRFATEKCSACHTAIHGSNTNRFFLEE